MSRYIVHFFYLPFSSLLLVQLYSSPIPGVLVVRTALKLNGLHIRVLLIRPFDVQTSKLLSIRAAQSVDYFCLPFYVAVSERREKEMKH